MAELLKENGEVIIADYGYYWCGRTTTGQALYMDWVIQEISRQTDNSNVSKEQQQNLKHQMKQRIFKAGIEYYEARAEYCHYLAENAYEREFKIWTDIMLDFMAELDRQTENKTESPM